MNIFAYEKTTVQNYFLYPLDLRTVLLAKNAANLTINLVTFMIMVFGLCIFNHPQMTVLRLLTLFLLFVYSNILAQGLGNIISIFYSMRVNFSHLLGLFNPFPVLIIMIPVIFIIVGPVTFAGGILRDDIDYLLLALVCFTVSVMCYHLLRQCAARLLVSRRTILIHDLNSQEG
jgi:hypothetical protein